MAPGYLSELRRPVSALQGRRHVRSTGRVHLDFPRVRRATVVCLRWPICLELITGRFKKHCPQHFSFFDLN